MGVVHVGGASSSMVRSRLVASKSSGDNGVGASATREHDTRSSAQLGRSIMNFCSWTVLTVNDQVVTGANLWWLSVLVFFC